MRSLFAVLVLTLVLGACSSDAAEGSEQTSSELQASGVAGPPVANEDRQLNVTLLLDLSDRVDPHVNPATPSHRDRDLAVASAVADAFVAEMEQKGAFAANGRIRTLFSPAPDDPAVNEIARGLAKDLRSMSPADKKTVHDELATEYAAGLGRIYDAVIAASDYVGADVWRFFKDGDALNLAVDPDPGVRNVLVVLTDGYAYHEDTVLREANRTSYVTGSLLAGEGLRDATGWRERFDTGDYGFLDPGVDLPRLEILVLEVAPTDGHPGDFEVLRAYWEGLFEAMEIGRYEVLKSDLPTNTAPLIRSFFQGAGA